jgi:hypothetical protein
MAIQVSKTKAAGNSGVDHSGPNNKTPPQAKQSPAYDINTQATADQMGSKEFEKDYTWGRSGYGANAFSGASSDTPNHRTRAALTVNDDDGDEVLNTIKNRGLARDPSIGDGTDRTFPMAPSSAGGFDAGAAGDEMLRSLSDGQRSGKGRVPVHSAMAPRAVDEGSPGGSVGSGLTNNQSDPVRKPS